jgi:hypothetical protein
MGKQFDELAKGLASGQSRRKVLRTFAVGVAGAIVATILPNQTAHAGVRKSDLRECDQTCREAFGRSKEYKVCFASCIACALKDGEFVVNATKVSASRSFFINGTFPILNGRGVCLRDN